MIARVLGTFFFLTATPALAADMTGTWSISGAIAPICSFTQTGDVLGGACKGASAEGPLTGSISGQAVKWTYNWKAYAGGNPGSFEFSGTLTGDAVSGTATINGKDYPFGARRMPNTPAIALGGNDITPPLSSAAPPAKPLDILDRQPGRTQSRIVQTAVASPEPLIRISASQTCSRYPFPMMGRTPGGGQVALSYLVGADGNVITVNPLAAGGNPMLVDFAMACVRSWKFRPLSETGTSAPFAAQAAVIVTFHRSGSKLTADMQWQMPRMREASDIASYELAALAYNCLRANPLVAPLARATAQPTTLIITLRHGDITDVSLKSSSGNDLLDRADLACYRGLTHDDERAQALEKLSDLGISTSWQTLFAAP